MVTHIQLWHIYACTYIEMHLYTRVLTLCVGFRELFLAKYIFIATFLWQSHQKSFYILWYHWQCLYSILVSEKNRRREVETYMFWISNVRLALYRVFYPINKIIGHIITFILQVEKLRLREGQQLAYYILWLTQMPAPPTTHMHTNSFLDLETSALCNLYQGTNGSQRSSSSFFF